MPIKVCSINVLECTLGNIVYVYAHLKHVFTLYNYTENWTVLRTILSSLNCFYMPMGTWIDR